MAHEGNHELIDLILAILNLLITIIAILFLVKLIKIYLKQKKEDEEIFMLHDHVSFSYQSSLSGIDNDDGKDSKYVLYFSIAGIGCVAIAGLFGSIFYSETYFTYQSTFSSAAFESIHELFWNLGEIACYLLFVDRLRFGLGNTSHKISTAQFAFFWISTVIYLLCVLAYCLYEFNSVSSMFYTTDAFSWIYVFGIELS